MANVPVPPPDEIVDTPLELLSELRDQHAERDDKMATCLGRRAELMKLANTEGKWSFYRVLCQFRLGYFSFLVMMVILMFAFTFLMEIFFAIFLPSARMDPNFTIRSIIMLAILPFALIFLSYLFEESSRLFIDALDKSEGSLNDFRLSMCVVIHYLRHQHEMPDDRLHKNFHYHYHGLDEDAAAWKKVMTTIKSIPHRIASNLRDDDPFDDKNKEEEDLKREEIELEFQQSQELGITDLHKRAESPVGSATNRWKKAMYAASTSVVFNKTRFDGPELDFSTLVLVDIFCPFLFEVITFWSFLTTLLATLSPVDAFLMYIQTGFYTTFMYLGVWMGCHFWSCRNRKMREFVSNYRRRRRDLKRSLRIMEAEKRAENLWLVDVGFRAYEYFQTLFFTIVEFLFVVCCRRRSHAATTGIDDEKTPLMKAIDANEVEKAVEGKEDLTELKEDVQEKVESWNPWGKFSYKRRIYILIPIVVLSAIISFSAFYLGWIIMGFSLILLGYTIQGLFPQIFGTAFRSFITAFVILSFVFFSSTWAIGTFVTGGDFIVLPPSINSTLSLSATTTHTVSNISSTWSKVAQYPVCSLDFSTLDIVDFALIADAVYGMNTSIQQMSFGQRFNGTDLADWEYVTRNNETTDHQVWVELYFKKINMTVIAVRGTASATDALEDLHFWFGVSIMQAANIFVPFLKQLPTAFVVSMLSMSLLSDIMPPPVFMDLVEHVTEVRKRVGKNLVLTGHSLGGAMAAMVGAKTKTPAVSFSGPGLLYSRGRFDVEDNDIRDYVLTIKPRRDIVPKVDELGGMVQEIECRLSNPLACHSTTTHMCELRASCGDKRHRDWSLAEQCVEYFS